MKVYAWVSINLKDTYCEGLCYIPLKGLLRMSETNMSKEQVCDFERKVEDEGHKLSTALNIPPQRPTKYKAWKIFIGDGSSEER